VVIATPWPLYPREGPSTHCVGGGPESQSGQVQKISSPPGFNPWIVQKGTNTDTGRSVNETFSAEQKEDTNTLLFKGREIGHY